MTTSVEIIGIKLHQGHRLITSGLMCEYLDTIEIIIKENVAATAQNIERTAAETPNMSSGKKVKGHGPLGPG